MRLSLSHKVCIALAVVFAIRLVAGAVLPLSADEAYYWLWAQHPDLGYFDHPPMIAWLIWVGTHIFGNTPFGVRIFGILTSFAASWFVWQAAVILLGRRAHGAMAALLFNLTLMVGVETLASTPDAPSIFTASVFFWALARFAQSHDGRWWLAVGAAAGLGLLSKYSALFLGLGALVWLIFSAPYRKALKSPWPYLGALLAFAIWSPNIWWNATHGWHTFMFQFGRIDHGEMTGKYILDFIGGQLVLASPFVLILCIYGLVAGIRNLQKKSFLPAAMILPSLFYFLIHALHARVQGNWPCFLYPMLAVTAAEMMICIARRNFWDRVRYWSAEIAVPVAAMLLLAAYLQALIGVLPMGRKDPLARLLAVGMPQVTDNIAALENMEKAGGILTTDYATTSWLAFYMPGHPRITLVGEDYRFPDLRPLNVREAAQPMLYVTEARHIRHMAVIRAHFARVRELARFDRMRKGIPIAHYVVFLVRGPLHDRIGRVVMENPPDMIPPDQLAQPRATPASVPTP